MAYASSFSMDYHSLPLALLILLWGVNVLASSVPAAFDWRNSNCVTPVKIQAACDHSWAFAAVSVVESALLHYTTDGHSQPLDLSEQQVPDCSKDSGSLGCIKGNVYDALSFMMTHGDLSREHQYPYIGVSPGFCRLLLGVMFSPLGLKPCLTVGNDENELAKALLNHG